MNNDIKPTCKDCADSECIKCGRDYKACRDFQSRDKTGCSYASYDEGWKCSVTDCACVFFVPNAKACKDTFYEGPLAGLDERCDTCSKFYLHNGCRCCENAPLKYDEVNNDIIESEFIDVDVVACGSYESNEGIHIDVVFVENDKTTKDF